jgi:hypothetical protein
MSRKHLFVTDSRTGKTTQLKGDPAHLSRQVREHRAAGREVTVLTDDERIDYARLAEQIAQGHAEGRIR